MICMQEVHLAHKYGKIYWNTSCLSINASADEDSEDNSSTDYGKIAKAICEIKERGEVVLLPDINKSKFGFRPTEEGILFGLKAINNIGDDISEQIIVNRPYLSLSDFMQKNESIKGKKLETLIKSGCFDNLYNGNRIGIMNEYIKLQSNIPNILTLSHIEDLVALGLLTDSELKNEFRVYKYRKYVFNKDNLYDRLGKSDTTARFILDEKYALPYFYDNFEKDMKEDSDYYFENGLTLIKKGGFERVYKKRMSGLLNRITTKEFYDEYYRLKTSNILLTNEEIYYSTWERESLNFYFNKHELNYFNLNLSSWNKVKTTNIIGYTEYRNVSYPRYELSVTAGMILKKDKNKHILDILTQDGVLKVKFHKNMFAKYDKGISENLEDGKKKVVEKSWFQRGNIIKVVGYSLNGVFRVKTYFDSIYKNPVELVVVDDCELNIKSVRES